MATEVSARDRQRRFTGTRSDEELGDLSFREVGWEYELKGYRSLKLTLVPFVLLGVILWLLQWWLAPNWLVNSRSDVDTLLTGLPAVAIALLAVMIAGLLVAVQVAAESYRSTGVGILIRDMRTWGWVYAVTGIAFTTLFLGAVAPAEGDPPDSLTAALATIAILFGVLFLSSGRLLKTRLAEYTNPQAISQFAAASGYGALEEGDWRSFERHLEETGLVVLYAVRDQDSTALVYALGTLEELFRACLDSDGSPETVGGSVATILVRAGEESIGLDSFADSSREISNSLYAMAVLALERSDERVATELIHGLGRLGTRSWTFATVGLYIESEPRNLTTPLGGLADLAWRAAPGYPATAVAAVECWVLGVAYVHREARARHPGARAKEMAKSLVAASFWEFGQEPDWQPVLDALQRRSFLWALAWREDAKELLEALIAAADQDPAPPAGTVIDEAAATWAE